MSDVTQEDRDAAAPHSPRGHGTVAGYTFSASYMIRNGHWDDDPLVQAFARHRQSTQSSLAAENARLREAGALAADMLDMMLECWVQDRVISDEEGRQATGALMDLNAALKGE